MTTPLTASVPAFPAGPSPSSPSKRMDRDMAGNVRRDTNLVLVDDDPHYREAVTGELAEHGFEVVGFADGPPALEYFAQGHSADAVVLDWRLPSMSGLDVLT